MQKVLFAALLSTCLSAPITAIAQTKSAQNQPITQVQPAQPSSKDIEILIKSIIDNRQDTADSNLTTTIGIVGGLIAILTAIIALMKPVFEINQSVDRLRIAQEHAAKTTETSIETLSDKTDVSFKSLQDKLSSDMETVAMKIAQLRTEYSGKDESMVTRLAEVEQDIKDLQQRLVSLKA